VKGKKIFPICPICRFTMYSRRPLKKADVITLSSSVVAICTTRFNTPKLCILPTQCTCVFRMVLTIKSDCFPKRHWPARLCSGDVICFLWGTNWIFICYLEKESVFKGLTTYVALSTLKMEVTCFTKRWCLSTKLDDVTFQKTVILTLTAVREPHVTSMNPVPRVIEFGQGCSRFFRKHWLSDLRGRVAAMILFKTRIRHVKIYNL
jgi:hypothetical protein